MVHEPIPNARAMTLLSIYEYLTNHTSLQPAAEELVEKGWMEMIKAGLVGISTSGFLVWTGATAGGRNVTEVNSSAIYLRQLYGHMVGGDDYIGGKWGVVQGGNPGVYGDHVLAYKNFTLAGGVLADTQLVAAVAGYRPVLQLLALTSDTAKVYEFTFQTEDNVAVETPVTVVKVNAAVAGATYEIDGHLLVIGIASKTVEVDIAGGAGGEKLTLIYRRWWEV